MLNLILCILLFTSWPNLEVLKREFQVIPYKETRYIPKGNEICITFDRQTADLCLKYSENFKLCCKMIKSDGKTEYFEEDLSGLFKQGKPITLPSVIHIEDNSFCVSFQPPIYKVFYDTLFVYRYTQKDPPEIEFDKIIIFV